jgi:ABC-type ATPase involved in cell division
MTISAGKYINVGTKIARGIKDTPEFLQIEDYTKNIDEAMQWKVILSDTETQQHWLADGASVILHLCRA